MPKTRQESRKQKEQQEKRLATPTFLLELPLVVDPGQAARLRAHLEAARQVYNAILSEGQKRLRRMRATPAWQEARALPRTQKAERAATFSSLRKVYGFTEAALHEAVKGLRVGWIAEHIESVLAQTLTTRAYNRVCLGKATRVRFESRGRGFASIENKLNDTSLRFVLQPPEAGKAGFLLWNGDSFLPAAHRKSLHGRSAFLAAYLDPADPIPSCARYLGYWEGAEARLVAGALHH